MNQILNVLLVAVGGAVGATGRYLLSLVRLPCSGIWMTLAVNVLGSFALGLITRFVGSCETVSPQLMLFLRVGLCGGFTTFSTFALETQTLLSHGDYLTAFVYVVLSVLLGLGALKIGGLNIATTGDMSVPA